MLLGELEKEKGFRKDVRFTLGPLPFFLVLEKFILKTIKFFGD